MEYMTGARIPACFCNLPSMKNGLLTGLLCLLCWAGRAQISPADSMRLALLETDNDSSRFFTLASLGYYYIDVRTDSSLYFLKLAQSLAMKNNKPLSVAYALNGIGGSLRKLNAFGQGLEALREGFDFASNSKNKNGAWKVGREASNPAMITTQLHLELGNLLGATNNIDQQVFHYKEGVKLANANGDIDALGKLAAAIGRMYIKNNQLDSALILLRFAVATTEKAGNQKNVCVLLNEIGRVFIQKNRFDSASVFLYTAESMAFDTDNMASLVETHKILTNYYIQQGHKDSSLFYAQMSLDEGLSVDRETNLGVVYENLFRAYALNKQLDSAYKYQGLALTTKDSLYNEKIKVLSEYQNLNFAEKLKIQDLENEKELNQGKNRIYALLAGTGLILFLAFIFYRNSRLKQKAHDKIQKAYSELKETQKQLIQSEKMASLGELTAGIAHEIQNPLNFVKNFSEVNQELAEELKEYIDKGDMEEVKAIEDDIKANQEKIKYHGERADSIVKSMLQHSRTSTSQKEPTDINVLCDEYCRLAFHGMRAKDKSFNAEVKTQLSNILVPVNVIRQDIGRVVLNLINNALYAVDKKAKKGLPSYKPEVLLTTSKTGNNIEIKIKDNGDGIPDSLKEKIFQPFFTTKPTGEGTGLGLSLSYDIVTKGHGGELRMDSREGIGTTFTIIIPITG
jgi:signal transduction histidine kinase